jgi:predicted transposase YdaD
MHTTDASNITTPHNNLFVQVLSRKEKAIAFFAKYLPKPILEVANLNQVEIVESRHMSDAGLSLYNDILYRCPLGKEQVGYFFAMCEHQSKPDPHMPLRLAEYNLATIKGHLKQGHATFPVIVNTVLYTGKRPWNYSTKFSDYYASPSLGAQYLYMAPFSLVQLPIPTKGGEEIYTDKDLGFCFAAFYCGRSKDAYLEFERFKQIPAFKNYFNRLSVEERELVGRYIGLCVDRNRYSLEKIVNLIIINEQEKEELMRSVAQEYIKQGIEKGIEQGMQLGIQTKAQAIAKNMLKKGYAIKDIQEITSLSREAIEKLHKE